MSPVVLTVGCFLLCAEHIQEVIRTLADTDPLTGVLNHRPVFLLAENRMLAARRHPHAVSRVIADLDRFNRVNDEHGHAAGGLVLVHLTRLIRSLTCADDVFGRVGGDEFVLVLPYSDLHGAAGMAERFRDALTRQPVRLDDCELPVTASFGVATLHDEDHSPRDLLNRADRALYRAKAHRGNLVEVADQESSAP